MTFEILNIIRASTLPLREAKKTPRDKKKTLHLAALQNINNTYFMKYFFFVILSILVIGCAQKRYKNVGDIPFDEKTDNAHFEICNERNIKQYYVRRSADTPPNYKDEKRGLERTILGQYNFPETETENGYITIRFIVNCNGKTGRFRIEEMDVEYQPKTFNKEISGQLMRIVKSLDGWVPRVSKGKNVDFYQYLTFKIRNGQIVKILP